MLLSNDICLSRPLGIKNQEKENQNWHTGSPHHTRLGYHFQVKISKVNLQGRGNIVADSRSWLIFINSLIFVAPTAIGSKVRWAPQA